MPRNPRTKQDAGRPAVALLIETSNQYCRELLRGVRDYLRERGPWALHLTEQGRGGEPPPWLSKWHGDGVLARIENRAIERAVQRLKLPAVNASASGLAPEFPSVFSDSAAVARLAAEHLLERGLRHFAYCGDRRFVWSVSHGAYFADCVQQAGFKCSLFESTEADADDWEGEQARLGQWLVSLPKPVGIMACYDMRGQQVLDVCRRIGLQVPDEVAVIGQHNDEVLCELCDPPLTSVIPNPRLAGYQAAALLDGMMRGDAVAERVHRIAPLGVAARLSTDVVAVEDQDIARAVRFIRENALRGLGVEEVLVAVPISRSLLERKFRKMLGHSPYEAILNVRLRHACDLLATADVPIARVGELCGFSSAEHFSAAFKSRFGVCPRQYRRENRRAD